MIKAKNLTKRLKATQASLTEEINEYGGDNDRHAVTSYRLEPARMTLDLGDRAIGMRHNGPLTSGWGGCTLFQLTVMDRDKKGKVRKVHVWVSARISGDSRAGSQEGIHVRLTVGNRGKDVTKECHVSPAKGFTEDESN